MVNGDWRRRLRLFESSFASMCVDPVIFGVQIVDDALQIFDRLRLELLFYVPRKCFHIFESLLYWHVRFGFDSL